MCVCVCVCVSVCRCECTNKYRCTDVHDRFMYVHLHVHVISYRCVYMYYIIAVSGGSLQSAWYYKKLPDYSHLTS